MPGGGAYDLSVPHRGGVRHVGAGAVDHRFAFPDYDHDVLALAPQRGRVGGFGKHGVVAGGAAHSQGGPGVLPFAFGDGEHDLAPNIWSFGVSISATSGSCT